MPFTRLVDTREQVEDAVFVSLGIVDEDLVVIEDA